ncbi:hypothetical protein D046_4053E, partial [Vibrio parahaemolyticus V-223/04]
SIYGRGSRHH